MGAIFGGSPSAPTYRQEVTSPAAKNEDMAAQNAANAAMLRRRRAYGQSDTMLTSSDMAPATVSKKTLLGE